MSIFWQHWTQFGKSGVVRVFALNYATSCGNVCHQTKNGGETGTEVAWGPKRTNRRCYIKNTLTQREKREGGGGTVKCGGSNFTLQHRGNQKRK